MTDAVLPVFLLGIFAFLTAAGMLALGNLFGPRRSSAVKQMPYESGMDPVHDARRRFDVRFYLVAIAFLLFDVELLFLYPWAVAAYARPVEGPDGPISVGVDAAVEQGLVADRLMVFGGAMVFLALVVVGLIYDWRKGVLQWR